MINDHDVSMEAFTEQSRIQEYIFALVQSNIHDSLVKLMDKTYLRTMKKRWWT